MGCLGLPSEKPALVACRRGALSKQAPSWMSPFKYPSNHNVHCCTIYNSQDTKATSASIERGMDKDVVYIHNGILPSHKRDEIMPFAVMGVGKDS